jgi:hypothetical protein
MLRPLLRLFGAIEDTNTPAFAPGEVARHHHDASLWLTCRGVVYDVTDFVGGHPGGAMALTRRGGGVRDCAQDFDFHSATARKQWADFRIGVVADKTRVSNAAAVAFLEGYYARRGLDLSTGERLLPAPRSSSAFEVPASWSDAGIPKSSPPSAGLGSQYGGAGAAAGAAAPAPRQQPLLGSPVGAVAAICENCGFSTMTVSPLVGSATGGSDACSSTGASHRYCFTPGALASPGSVDNSGGDVVINGGRSHDMFARPSSVTGGRYAL